MEIEFGPAGAIRAEFLPAPQPTAKPAPSAPVIEIVSTPSSRDYMLESSIGTRLTPERLAWVFRQADFGQPALMFDVFESVVLNDGHTRGLFEQRLDEVAAVPWTLRPGDARGGSQQAVDALTEALVNADVAGAIEHIALAPFYGCSYVEVAWQRRPDGIEVPVEFVCVPHKRFIFDTRSRARLTSEGNPYPGELLERRPGSSWMRAETKRWRKQVQAGMLRSAAWWCVFKRMSVREFMIFAEKFGIPFILGKYDETASETTRKGLKDAIAALGTEGRAILAHDAKVEILDQVLRSGAGDHLHSALIQLCNSEISKVITAGTLTADTGGPGSFALGQVHADQKHKLSLADARRIGNVFCRDTAAPRSPRSRRSAPSRC
jgi:phage gp29-like protein